ncbi:MAG: cold shock domain-containing protein [Cyclobacteriaceae bacterium]|nr:cold shock domain-containing protein [Cyclobacteriaceae bacterium]
MAKSQETFNKKEKENKKRKKREEKERRREERKANATDGSLESMMAYVDENGNITSTPPDPNKQRKKINAESIEIGVPKRKDTEDADGNRVGVVSFFNESKGFGFIKDLNTQESIFTHINGHLEPIKENNRVTFQVERGPKGLNAVRVKVAK